MTRANNDFTAALKQIMDNGIGVPVILLMLLMMLILPLPPILLDLLFTFNISLSLLVLLSAIYALRPLDFGVFPTVLLIATLLRLALNIASTRVVLLNGHSGADAAGEVIQAFGEVVIGGNYAVGIVVFSILIIINFVVVTKGAGRISEVSARFTLDAMPGKQMAIDADMSSGIITQEEAKLRREEVAQESSFYGSMDGASKFVRGDAIAGILILFINMIGGMCIGVFQHRMQWIDALEVYALLTIGDGLVAQIPGLLLSIAAAIMVTRVSRSEDMRQQIISQVIDNPKALGVSSAVLAGLGLIPGMPHLAFLGLSAAVGAGAYYMAERRKKVEKVNELAVSQEVVSQTQKTAAEVKELGWDDVPVVDVIGLEIGFKLIPLVDKNQSGELMVRIKGVRKKLSQELGFLIPTIHIKDNLDLGPNNYKITVLGVTVGESIIYPEKDLAINPGQVFGEMQGIKTQDPAFGLSAVWIDKNQKEQSQTLGYTVVDSSTVLATHLSQVLQKQAYQLVGHEEVQKLLEKLGKSAPKLIEDLVPKLMPLGTIVKVLHNLLSEGVPIRDMRTIAETLAEHGQKIQDPGILTVATRIALGPLIVQQINGFAQELPVITLHPSLEQILHKSIQNGGDDGMVIEPGLSEKLSKALKKSAEQQETEGNPSVLVVSGAIRTALSRFLKNLIPGLAVLSYQEVPDDKHIRIVSTIGDI